MRSSASSQVLSLDLFQDYTSVVGADTLSTLALNKAGRNLIMTALNSYYRQLNIDNANDSGDEFIRLLIDLYD